MSSNVLCLDFLDVLLPHINRKQISDLDSKLYNCHQYTWKCPDSI